jgi:hypothetical protein
MAGDAPVPSLIEAVLLTWGLAYLGYRALMRIVGKT